MIKIPKERIPKEKKKKKRYNNVRDENSQRERIPKGTHYHLSVDAKDSFQIEDIQSLVWEANLSCNLT